MTTLTQASHQWATRPADERFVSLLDMKAHFTAQRAISRELVVSSRKMVARPTDDNRGIEVVGPNGHPYIPTHWAFRQLAERAEAPAKYLRTLPSPIAADCVNYGLQFKRNIEDVGLLLQKNGDSTMRAVTGPNYGRIWCDDVTGMLVSKFGDGVSGDWRVPGEFKKAVTVTKDNTTLYAGDRDMFVFLADEKNRIEVPNRRNGQPGSLARGFFIWNSEVGSTSFGLGTFLFDYVCCNRMVWGASQYKEVRLRHTASAPDRFLEEMLPALKSYAAGSSDTVVKAIERARSAKIADVDAFLARRFSTRMATSLVATHLLEEGRPIETLWDATVAITAQARAVPYQNERVALEKKAGELLDLAG